MSDFVQVVLPTQGAQLLAVVLRDAVEQLYIEAQENEGGLPDVETLQVIDQLAMLGEFFGQVSANPRGFPVTGKMAAGLKKRAKFARGLGPAKRKPRRMTRHKRRIELAKERRANRAEIVERHNVLLELADQAGLEAPFRQRFFDGDLELGDAIDAQDEYRDFVRLTEIEDLLEDLKREPIVGSEQEATMEQLVAEREAIQARRVPTEPEA